MDIDENILDEYTEELDEATPSEMPAKISKSISLDDLNDTPERDKFFKVTKGVEIAKDQILTIGEVKINPPALIDNKGKDLVETNSKGNKYYKGRLEVRFVEEVNGMKLREFLPGLFYSVDKNGQVQLLPSVPKASDQLEDPFTNTLAKLRYKFSVAKKLDSKDVSDKMFLKGLVGMKVKVKKVEGKNPKDGNKEWSKLEIVEFVN